MQTGLTEIDIAGLCLNRNRKEILQSIDWNVRKGENWAVLGPNGCGKSTLLAAICGYQPPTSGRLTIFGQTIGQTVLADIQRQIFLFQPGRHNQLLQKNLTAVQIVQTGAFSTLGLYDSVPDEVVQQAYRLLEEAGLSYLAERRYNLLSSGERCRVLFARGQARSMRLFLLDEPFENLDLYARESFISHLETLLENPVTVVLVTHRVEDLPSGITHVMLLKKGRVVAAGEKNQILTSAALTNLYDWPVEVLSKDGRYHVSVKPRR